jgi:hypothetical protein
MTESRCAGRSRREVALIVAVVVVVLIFSIWPAAQGAGAGPGVSTATGIPNADLFLYQAVVEKVRAGGDYYAVAAHELRTRDFPLRPFITYRLPTLAWVQAGIGMAAAWALFAGLALATIIAWWARLEGAFARNSRRVTGAMLVAAGLAIATSPGLIFLHELWAGMLLALSFALWRPGEWRLSLAAALAALLIRELALPYVLLMGAVALWNRRWGAAAAWGGVVGLFVVVIAWHFSQVVPVTLPSDAASPGWLSIGGWPGFMRAFRLTSALRVFPVPLGAIGVVLCLAGWLSWKAQTGSLGAIVLLGYGLFFATLGRPNNFYWGLMIAPLLLLGLAFLPQAVADLVRSWRDPSWTGPGGRGKDGI